MIIVVIEKSTNVNQSRTLIFQLLTFCADYLLCIFILLPFAESFKKGCCQLQGKVLVNCLFKLAQEKVWLVN